MRRPRRKTVQTFTNITIEGALISPAVVGSVNNLSASDQKEADYGVPKGLTLRDEIARYFRIGCAVFAEWAASESPSNAATTRLVQQLLTDVFGFKDVAVVGHRDLDGQTYPVTVEAAGGRVPVVVTPPNDELDRASEHLRGEGHRRSAASAAQDWLNANDDALWGLAFNGERLRLLRDNASLTRPAYIEANLRQIFEGEDFADFTLLWLLVHASRFGNAGAPVADCPLERWRDAGAKEGLAARDRLREGFEAALETLGSGFLAANTDLRDRVVGGALPMADFFGQLLRLVYRLIFLMVAEDRSQLHAPGAAIAVQRLYADGYSLASLRERAARRSAWDAHRDRWEGLKITFHALLRGEPRLGLPALGGLFAEGAIPDLERAVLGNRALMEAVWRLAWIRHEGVLTRVNWKDMETEELGSVYESLLELTPRLADDGRTMTFAIGAETKGNTRKTTGSYYTPDSLVQLLLDSALDPVLDRVESEAADPDEGLLSVTVIDPACGSGHFLLGAARRIATRLAKARTGGLASREDYRHALRDVVRHCIHGVDRNPMAVELTKVALWIESVDPGRPLGFLDANIRCGDALLGVFDLAALDKGIPDAAYKPLSGDDRDAARVAGKVNRDQRERPREQNLLGAISATGLARESERVLAMPEEDVAALQRKSEAYTALHAKAGWGARKLACDLYVAAFLRRKRFRNSALVRAQTPDDVPTTLDVWTALSGGQSAPQLSAVAVDLAEEAHAFHWPLEFPTVVSRGGFDVVLGNPPWERIKLQEQEFFAAIAPEIAEAPNAAARGRLISALSSPDSGSRDQKLYEDFVRAKRTAEAASQFARISGSDGGRFPLSGRGDVNTYALFVELFVSLLRSRGRSGLICPTGLATDFGTSNLFARLIEGRMLRSLFSFENESFIFPSVHHSFRFSLVTIGVDESDAKFAFFLRTPESIRDPHRVFGLSKEDIALVNPITKTAPIFRTERDAEITRKIYRRVPIFVGTPPSRLTNPWRVTFHTRIWHMAEDSSWFVTDDELKRRLDTPSSSAEHTDLSAWLPLYEAKMLHQFDHRWATYQEGEIRDASELEKANPSFEPQPRYWVPGAEVRSRLRERGWDRSWLLAWRDITSAHVMRTVIADAIPLTAAGHKSPLIFSEYETSLVALLLANLNSLVLDFVARQKVGSTSLTVFYLQQFPVLSPDRYSPSDVERLSRAVCELIYTSDSMEPFARELGYNGRPFAWDEVRRAWLRAELDAWYARAYGLTRDELRYILDPADVMGPDYPSETFRVLKTNEMRKYGEYRTRRLVLQAWDEQEAASKQ